MLSNKQYEDGLVRVCRNRLTLCIASFLGLAAPSAFANSVFVTNCSDTGAGSLRAAVASAISGDTVDMSGLTAASPGCSASTITLRTGDIKITQDNLTITGPGMTKLTVTGNYGTIPNDTVEPYRIFTHTGTGALTLEYFSVSKGYNKAPTNTHALGGCVYSTGSVSANHMGFYSCTASAATAGAEGGAIYATNGIFLKYSVVDGNSADSGNNAYSIGGGLYTRGDLTIKYSTVSGNRAAAISGDTEAIAGGAFTKGTAYIRSSTVSSNSSASFVGGLALMGSASATKIIDSTITGNVASGYLGGVAVQGTTIGIYNSTIAFNSSDETSQKGDGSGLYVAAGSVTLESTLIANNTYGPSKKNNDMSIGTQVVVSGSHNLVRVSSASLPSDTITGKCPILDSLRKNGGVTETMALESKSPGIDAGNNVYSGSNGTVEDQRGKLQDTAPYSYPRSSGAAPDIGAYEIQVNDIIYTNNFEGCT